MKTVYVRGALGLTEAEGQVFFAALVSLLSERFKIGDNSEIEFGAGCNLIHYDCLLPADDYEYAQACLSIALDTVREFRSLVYRKLGL